MKLNEYQTLTHRTGKVWDEMPFDTHRMLLAMGLGGEAGEVLEVLKKEIGHGRPRDDEHTAEELGDVLWYVSELARLHGWTLDEVAEANIAKLKRRYPAGFELEPDREEKEWC